MFFNTLHTPTKLTNRRARQNQHISNCILVLFLSDCKCNHCANTAWDGLKDQGMLHLKHIMNKLKTLSCQMLKKTCLHLKRKGSFGLMQNHPNFGWSVRTDPRPTGIDRNKDFIMFWIRLSSWSYNYEAPSHTAAAIISSTSSPSFHLYRMHKYCKVWQVFLSINSK